MLASCNTVLSGESTKDTAFLNQCSLSPSDSSVICVTGNGLVKFFKMNENHLEQLEGGLEEKGMQYLAHAWVPDEPGRLLVTTSNGDLLWFEDQVCRFPLPLSPSDGLSINSISTYSKGFVCGGEVGLIHYL
ncbi:hypothetical protein STCU_10661 [Strigomonas culicis]|uniref:Uncharacterized protein n=1 Tax=Strigomonas culicis TaxID=28005 RepID=S9TH25_9TRYP|nr:hypothetical protein STCU_10661 [Strigomonas culicis]|eukprot:EPY17372.1 hypothetical protein STCU_10661 [Strigomonas culicis]